MDDRLNNGAMSTPEQVRSSEVRYRRLFETAKDGILLLDADTGRITDVNPFLQDMLGYSHSELMAEKQMRHGSPQPNTITLSAGIAGSPEHGSTAAELLHAADNAMYAAKQGGRDRVVAYRTPN